MTELLVFVVDTGVCRPGLGLATGCVVLTRSGARGEGTLCCSLSSSDDFSLSSSFSSSSSDSKTGEGGAVSKFSRDLDCTGRVRETLRLLDEDVDGSRDDLRGGNSVGALLGVLDCMIVCDSLLCIAKLSFSMCKRHLLALSETSLCALSNPMLGYDVLTRSGKFAGTSRSEISISFLQDTRHVMSPQASSAARISGSPSRLSRSDTSYKHKTPSILGFGFDSRKGGHKILPLVNSTDSLGVSSNCKRYDAPPSDTFEAETEATGRRRSRAFRMNADLPTFELPTTMYERVGISS